MKCAHVYNVYNAREGLSTCACTKCIHVHVHVYVAYMYSTRQKKVPSTVP